MSALPLNGPTPNHRTHPEAYCLWMNECLARERRAVRIAEFAALIAAGDRDAIAYDKWERARIRRNALARARYAAKKAKAAVEA